MQVPGRPAGPQAPKAFNPYRAPWVAAGRRGAVRDLPKTDRRRVERPGGTRLTDVGHGPTSARPHTVALGGIASQISLAQALHFVASTALSVLQNGHPLTGAASSSLMSERVMMNTTKATVTNVMIELMKTP